MANTQPDEGFRLLIGAGDGVGIATGDPAPDAPPAEDPVPADPEAPAAEKPKADDTDWKAESRKHEARAKANAEAAKELAKLKAAQMTDDEKRAAESAQTAKERDEARAELAIERAARKHGITDDKDLELLFGIPADKVDALAKALSERNKPAPAGRSGNPVEGEKPKRTPTTLTGAIGAHYA
ncbi:hypothetical protein [Rhodococcus sp. UNC363MFTsu5.1]|uniref:hypothetical protein n=1 Tax=Rhodococcus sp. UNC363MFTsu5.1 TaxID=1449069 RepID=UPI0004860864|nr:hypothetical protein [Rhodococcus sp. UNC363MFTsu5.1]